LVKRILPPPLRRSRSTLILETCFPWFMRRDQGRPSGWPSESITDRDKVIVIRPEPELWSESLQALANALAMDVATVKRVLAAARFGHLLMRGYPDWGTFVLLSWNAGLNAVATSSCCKSITIWLHRRGLYRSATKMTIVELVQRSCPHRIVRSRV
jgi:hypothetical protein